MSGQKTRHQKLNSYLVMNSLGDKNLSTQKRYPPKTYTRIHTCTYIYTHTYMYIYTYISYVDLSNINALYLGGGTRCSRRVSVPCFTCDTCHKLCKCQNRQMSSSVESKLAVKGTDTKYVNISNRWSGCIGASNTIKSLQK